MWKRVNKVEMHGKVPAEISSCGLTKGGTGLAKKLTQAFYKMVPKTRTNVWANPLFISRLTLFISPVALARETVEQSRWGVCHKSENHSDSLKKASADCTGRSSWAASVQAQWECWPVPPQLLPQQQDMEPPASGPPGPVFSPCVCWMKGFQEMVYAFKWLFSLPYIPSLTHKNWPRSSSVLI